VSVLPLPRRSPARSLCAADRAQHPASAAGGVQPRQSRRSRRRLRRRRGFDRQALRAAWALFQEIESAGGAPAALEQGLIQGKIAKVRAERESAVTHRKDSLTGTSEYPLLSEAPVKLLDATPVRSRRPPPRSDYPALKPHRLAEPFEVLRDASDKMLAATGVRPKISRQSRNAS